MRAFGLTCAACLLCGAPALAQNAAPLNSEQMDGMLVGWQQRMFGLQSFTAEIVRTATHPLTKKSTTYKGNAAFMRPNLAFIDLTPVDELGKKDADKTNFERIYCDGQFIYEFSPKEKQVVKHALPKTEPADDSMLLAFVRGMKAAELRKRFELSVSLEKNGWFAHFRLTPKMPADKQAFADAELVIWAKNPNQQGQPDWAFLPSRLWYRQPNGTEVMYSLSSMQPNARLNAAAFRPRKPEGYEEISASTPESPSPAPKTPAPRAPSTRQRHSFRRPPLFHSTVQDRLPLPV